MTRMCTVSLPLHTSAAACKVSPRQLPLRMCSPKKHTASFTNCFIPMSLDDKKTPIERQTTSKSSFPLSPSERTISLDHWIKHIHLDLSKYTMDGKITPFSL